MKLSSLRCGEMIRALREGWGVQRVKIVKPAERIGFAIALMVDASCAYSSQFVW